MVPLKLETDLPGPPEKVRSLLRDRALLERSVLEQHPTDHRVDVDESGDTGTAAWTVNLPAGVPAIVKQFVGQQLRLTLTADVGHPGHLHLDAVGKKSGEERTPLQLAPIDSGTCVVIEGGLVVSAGLFSGQAAKMARDQVVEPVLRDDLFRLLREACDCAAV